MKLAAEGHQCYVTASYRNICAGTVMDLILKSWICQQQRALYASLRVAVPSPPFCITGGGGWEGTATRRLLKCFPALLSYEQ